MARREKKVGSDPTLLLMLLGGVAVVGIIMVVYFVKMKQPIMEGRTGTDDYVVAKVDGDVGPIEVSDKIHTSDPEIKAYQTWQHAKKISRDDLERGLAMCEGTIEYVPQYAGDAYFTCVQCIEHYLETRLFLKRHLPKDQMPMTKSVAKRYFDREMVYYEKAKQAYATEGAKTMLGLSRKPDEMINRIDEKIRDKVEGIIPWWMERLPD